MGLSVRHSSPLLFWASDYQPFLSHGNLTIIRHPYSSIWCRETVGIIGITGDTQAPPRGNLLWCGWEPLFKQLFKRSKPFSFIRSKRVEKKLVKLTSHLNLWHFLCKKSMNLFNNFIFSYKCKLLLPNRKQIGYPEIYFNTMLTTDVIWVYHDNLKKAFILESIVIWTEI